MTKVDNVNNRMTGTQGSTEGDGIVQNEQVEQDGARQDDKHDSITWGHVAQSLSGFQSYNVSPSRRISEHSPPSGKP